MNSAEIRSAFLTFFKNKKHQIVSSAPMVIKNDPTLMFTNAGMNQFKDLFLGNMPINHSRIANTQKCLRVSGKHNDLEEVGHDTYHHTMFEMLGNWSFGDYFKEEAIAWAWELLTKELKVSVDKLYVTVFGGALNEGLDADEESVDIWKKFISEDRILRFDKKDNFWEMGDTGPCGPCTEIHIDLRSDKEILETKANTLVNTGHPQVIEIWNLVFIQYNRLKDNSLHPLPLKHVDTGMGFERLAMVLQNKTSNYDTDIFTPLISKLEKLSGCKYGKNETTDVAFRVIADHVRAVSFSIADGQLPSNNKAGYVIRRILRRAIRYGYSFMGLNQPFVHKLISVLANQYKNVFPELYKQQSLAESVVKEEEVNFLRTLENGIKRFEQSYHAETKSNTVSGKFAFELYDTFGFPIDLTELLAREKELSVDIKGFEQELRRQQQRSRNASSQDISDWITIRPEQETLFVGYDMFSTKSAIIKYRKVRTNKEELFHILLTQTPFYAESGGQVGDAGLITNDIETIEVIDTLRENNLILHITRKLPKNLTSPFTAQINKNNRISTARNHSATHLLHKVLRDVLGKHVEQKGSLVTPDYFRFDFSHFSKIDAPVLAEIEASVNSLILENISLKEKRNIPINEAINLGALALFGEKYDEKVRVIQFGKSIELCGGTHITATGQIGLFKITSESSIASGIRRIEAITGFKAIEYVNGFIDEINNVKQQLKTSHSIVIAIQKILGENTMLKKQIQALYSEKAKLVAKELFNLSDTINDVPFIGSQKDFDSADTVKKVIYLISDYGYSGIIILAGQVNNKPMIAVSIANELTEKYDLHAGKLIKELAKEIKGGGGGQPTFATAGGSEPSGLSGVIDKAYKLLADKLEIQA